MSRRRLLAPLAVAAGLASAPAAAQAADTTSSNWAGYVADGTTFKHVEGSWVQPTIACSGRRTYSATWVGLGGSGSQSDALEQLGTEADCSSAGTARYSAWYELVPQASKTIKLTVKPGDLMTAAVTVAGQKVTLRLVDHTSRASFTTVQTASNVDTTSAEWIVEAPALCTNDGRCEQTPLANFATTKFTSANATSTAGRTAPLGAWNPTSIDLASGGRHRFGGGFRHRVEGFAGQALTSELSASGKSFTIAYADGTTGSSSTG